MRLLLYALLLLILPLSVVSAQPSRKKPTARELTCADVCGSLAKAIQDDPRSLVTRLEDALVIGDGCTTEVVATAIAAVNGQPQLVRQILDTAQNVLPWKRREIMAAAELASIPAAVAVVEPAMEVRPAQIEVRRALVAAKKSETPIEEVRRAEVPEIEIRRAVVMVTPKKRRR